MGGGYTPPPTPDYTGAALATNAGNLAMLQQQTVANRPNQSTPWGSINWTQTPGTPDTSAYNQAYQQWQQSGSQGPAPTLSQYTPTQWSETQTLTPTEQAAVNAQQQVQLNQSNLGLGLQGQVQSTMSKPLNLPNVNNNLASVPGVQSGFSGLNYSGPGVNTNVGTFNPNGPSVDTNYLNPNSYLAGVNQINQNFAAPGTNVNTNSQLDTAGAGSVNLNTPQFSNATAQAGANAAYGSATSLLEPQMQEQQQTTQAQLQAQGLTPGSVAYDNAMRDLNNSQSAQLNNLALGAVQTGNTEANQNYQSQLAGYNANLGAQNQAFGQGMGTFNANNAAAGQQFGQDLQGFSAGNTAINQAMQNAMTAYGANQGAQQAYNTAQAQNFSQGQSTFNTNLNALQAGNAAQGQAYNQALQGYNTSQTALANMNQAQQQAYQQALQTYGAQYTNAMNNYLEPLNAMNAVLNGQQVSTPQMPSFTNAGSVSGPDFSSATSSLGQWTSGVAAQQAASNSSLMNSLGSIAGAAGIAMMSDARMKKDIVRVGQTDKGLPIYTYRYKFQGNNAPKQMGVLAQEAEQESSPYVSPVVTDKYGIKYVDYSKIH